MNSFILTVFFVLISYSSQDEVCDVEAFKTCEPEEHFGFPESEDDLNRMCASYIPALDCVDENIVCIDEDEYKGDEDKYNGTNVMSRKEYEGMKGLIKEACRKDSLMHITLAQNLKCIKETLDEIHPICQQEMDATRTALQKLPGGLDDEYSVKDTCVFQLASMACRINNLEEKCGYMTKAVLAEIMKRMDVFDFCLPSHYEEIMQVIDDLDIKLQKKEELRDMINIFMN